MKHAERWQPSKYVFRRGRLTASRDPNGVGIGSRLIGDILADYFSQHLKQHCTGSLLDLGCGHVPLFEAYREFVDEVVCVDWAQSLHRNEFLDYECDLNKPLPFGDCEFDTIILSDVLEHISAPHDLWREMSRLLKPGGKVLLNVPFYYWLHEEPHDYYRYTQHALRLFAKTSGFEVLRLEAIGGAPEVVADILAKNCVQLGALGRTAAVALQYLCLRLVRSRKGTTLSRRTSAKFPLGYFLIAEKRYATFL